MPQLTTLRADELRACHQRIRERYDAFAQRGLKLNLTRGKPSSQQLDLCNELLALPGATTTCPARIDCRNYGELQGLPELRALLAPVFGVTADRVIIGDNSSLSPDARRGRVRAAQGHLRQRAAVVEGIARRISLPRARLRPAFLHLPGVRHRDDSRAAA